MALQDMSLKKILPIIISIVLGGVFFFSQCVVTQDGETKFQNIEEMSAEQFSYFQTTVELGTKIAARNLFEGKPETKELVTSFIIEVKEVLSSEDSKKIADLVLKLSNKIEDPDIRDLLDIGFILVAAHGGFTYIESELGFTLSERSISLVESIVNGLEAGTV